MSEQTGRVVWHDLMCTKPDEGAKFYNELFGWGINEVDMGMGPYKMLMNGENPIGGIVPFDASLGHPSHWIGYVNVDDVDAACQRADGAGGKTCVPPTDIPNVGRFAVVNDPAGAVISPFKGSGEPPPDVPPPVGSFIWDELLTNDTDACKTFYGELFGWSHKEMDMGPDGVYTIFSRAEEKDVAGMMKIPPGAGGPPHWIPYVHVDDVDAATEKLKSLGGTNYIVKEMPGIGRFSVNADPFGGTIATYKPDASGQ